MQSLSKLLAIQDSKIAQITRLNLIGLIAILQTVKKEFPQDTALTTCEQLLLEIEEILSTEQKPELVTKKIDDFSKYFETVSSSIPTTLEPILLPENNLNYQVSLPENHPELQDLGLIVNNCINLITEDQNLYHCWQKIHRFGLRLFLSDRSKYLKTLIDCFDRIEKSENTGELLLALKQRIDVDEAINSLVYIQPNQPNPSLVKLQKQSREILLKFADKLRQNGHKIIITNLIGTYADLHKYTKDDLEIDQKGTAGEVLNCVRVYAKINQEELPGRVLFTSGK
jgi:hypothetical protein